MRNFARLFAAALLFAAAPAFADQAVELTVHPGSGLRLLCLKSHGATGGQGDDVCTPLGLFDPVARSVILTTTAQSPGISSCGTGPSVAAGSSAKGGRFTLGTGSPTACTLTFTAAAAGQLPYPSAAYCTVTPASSYAGTYYISAQSKNSFTVTLGTGTSSAIFQYSCEGN